MRLSASQRQTCRVLWGMCGCLRFSWRRIREPSKSLCREGLWLDLFFRGISLIARKRGKTGARGPAELWKTEKMTMAGHGIWANAWGLGGSVPQGGIADFDWLISRDLTGVFNHVLKHFVGFSPPAIRLFCVVFLRKFVFFVKVDLFHQYFQSFMCNSYPHPHMHQTSFLILIVQTAPCSSFCTHSWP